MNFMLGLVATVAGVFVFVHVFTLVLIATRLLKLQLREQEVIPIGRADAGQECVLFDAARNELEQEGFRYVSTRRTRSMVASPSTFPTHSELYYHALHDVYAEVAAASVPTPHSSFDVYLWNVYTDGSTLLTVNGLAHLLIPYPRNFTIADPYAPTFKLHLAAHLAQRERIAVERAAAADAPALELSSANGLLRALEADGIAYRHGGQGADPVYGLRLMAAIRMAWRMRAGAARRKPMDAPRAEAAPEVRHAAEQISFVRTLCTLNGMLAPRWFQWSAFLISAAGFVALGSWWWGLSIALIIGAVVAVHEAGHWLAMKLAKFRDVHVFFVPGVGAATSGEKHEAHPLTHLAVYLAGPMPGLLLAVCAFAWLMFGTPDTSVWWYSAMLKTAAFAFLVNLLNLLPVMPLDGGRVVDLFVMGRFPWLRFGFALASGTLLVWAGATMDDNLLLGIGILYFLGVPHQYRLAKLSRDLLRQPGAAPRAYEDFGVAAARLYDFLSQPAYASWNHQAKVAAGQAILPRFLGRLPSGREAVLGTVIYIACIVAPLAALGALAAHDPDRVMELATEGRGGTKQPPSGMVDHEPGADPAEALRAARAATLAAATEPVRRRVVLAQLIDDADEADDYEDGLRLATLLHDETGQLPPPAREHADAALRLSNAFLAAEGKAMAARAARLLAEAETALRARLAAQADSADALLLARVLEARLRMGVAADSLSARHEIVDLHAAFWEQSGEDLPAARVALARALDQDKQAGAAEKQLHAAADDLARLPLTADYARRTLTFDTAWFLVSHQRPQEGVKQVERYLVQSGDLVPGRSYIQRDAYLLAAIAARMRGDWREVQSRTLAIQTFPKDRTGNWIADKFLSSRFSPPLTDERATLLLVEAERALGNNERADELVAALKKQRQRSGSARCRFHVGDDTWRNALMTVLAEIERRELQCTESAVCGP